MGITVSGEGRVAGTPDTLTLTIGISVEREHVSAATDDAARLASNLVGALEAEGIEKADIQTANYSIYPEYDHRDNHRRLIGYRVSNELRVKIRHLDRAGEIIDRAGSHGGDDVVVQGLSFNLEDNKSLLGAARDAAWHDARSKAEQLAGLAGVTLGAPTAISETFGAPVPIQRHRMQALAESAAMTPIEAGQLDVSITIQVTFGLD